MTRLRDLLAPHPSPVEVHTDLLNPKHAPLLHGLVAILLGGSIALTAAVLASPAEDTWRLIPAVGIGLLGFLVFAVLRLRGGMGALKLLIFGGWLLATTTAFFGEGVRSPILMTHSVLLIFSGWILGRAFARGCLPPALPPWWP